MSMTLGLGAPTGALLALLAAVSWGGGDFAGGMAVKAAGQTPRAALRVVLSAHALSLVALAAGICLTGAPSARAMRGAPVLWGLFAGLVAGLSLGGFYIALARGAMGSAAAVSGLLTAAIPAAIGIALEGRPGISHFLGFAVAAVAIWLIASPSGASRAERGTLWLAISSGVGFGIYFAALRFANPLGILGSLAAARTGSCLTCLLLLFLLRGGGARAVALEPSPLADAGGMVLGRGRGLSGQRGETCSTSRPPERGDWMLRPCWHRCTRQAPFCWRPGCFGSGLDANS